MFLNRKSCCGIWHLGRKTDIDAEACSIVDLRFEMKSPPFSQAADNNKDVVAAQIAKNLPAPARLLEIASGTGQHADHMTKTIPHVTWQPTDREFESYGLIERLNALERDNLLEPFILDIAHWPNLRPKYDAVYSANCLHVIPDGLVEAYVSGAGKSLRRGGLMLLYGPFRYDGEFTTQSNADFDRWLRERYGSGGIRDFEYIAELASSAGLRFVSDTPMPANNQFLVFRKQ